LGDFPSLEEKMATLALNLYIVRKQRHRTLLYNFFKQIYWPINLGTGKMRGCWKKADVSGLRYLGDFPSLTEKVATLALNLYTVRKQRKKSGFTTFLREMIG